MSDDGSETSVDEQEVKVVYDIVDVIQLRQLASREYLEINPVLRALVDGVCDENCVLGLLNGVLDVVQQIWDLVVSSWGRCIKEPILNEGYHGHVKNPAVMMLSVRPDVDNDYRECKFPKPIGIRINMMPFVMAETFEESRLPKYLEPYWKAFLGRKFWIYRSHYTEANITFWTPAGKRSYKTHRLRTSNPTKRVSGRKSRIVKAVRSSSSTTSRKRSTRFTIVISNFASSSG